MAKRLPTWYDKNYPEYKKILWGALRAFVAALVPTMGLMLMSASAEDFSSWESAKIFLLPVAIASFTAGVVGLGKFLRDIFYENELVQKIPI